MRTPPDNMPISDIRLDGVSLSDQTTQVIGCVLVVFAAVVGVAGCGSASPVCSEGPEAVGGVLSAEPYVIHVTPDARVVLAFVPDGFEAHELPSFREAARGLVAAALADQSLLGKVAPFVAAYAIEVRGDEGGAAAANSFGGCVRDGRLGIARDRVEIAVADALPGVRVAATIVVTKTRGRPATYGSVVVLGAGHGLPSLVHELGHALVGLGDEYAESDKCWSGPTPIFATLPDPFTTPNVTIDPKGTKWASLVTGAEAGGEGFGRCIYHPPGPCRMKDRREPRWCAVCEAEVTRWVAAVLENDGAPQCDIGLDARPERLVRGQIVNIDVIAVDHDGIAEAGATLDGRDILRADGALAPRYRADARAMLNIGMHTLSAYCRDADGVEARRDLVLQVR